MISIVLRFVRRGCLLPGLCADYLAEDIDVVVVVFVFLFVFVVEDDFSFWLFDGGFEYFVGPLVLFSPVVFFDFVFEVVVADVGVAVGDADVDAFVF